MLFWLKNRVKPGILSNSGDFGRFALNLPDFDQNCPKSSKFAFFPLICLSKILLPPYRRTNCFFEEFIEEQIASSDPSRWHFFDDLIEKMSFKTQSRSHYQS
jgi:hypothetical protein